MDRAALSARTPRRFCATLAALSLWFTTSGCETTAEIMKAKPAPDAGFVEDPKRMAPDTKRYPFDRVWFDSRFDWKDFNSIVIAPIDTTHLLKMDLWDEANLRGGSIETDAAKVAVEVREIFQKAFGADPRKRYEVVEQPGKTTVILELALVEVIPDKVWLGALGLASWAAPLPVGVPVGAAASMLEGGAIAMEGRVRDGGTRKVDGHLRRPGGAPDPHHRFAGADLVLLRRSDRGGLGRGIRGDRQHAREPSGQARAVVLAQAVVIQARSRGAPARLVSGATGDGGSSDPAPGSRPGFPTVLLPREAATGLDSRFPCCSDLAVCRFAIDLG